MATGCGGGSTSEPDFSVYGGDASPTTTGDATLASPTGTGNDAAASPLPGNDASETEDGSATTGDDAGSTDGDAVDSGAPPLSCTGLSYCEDFESYDGGAIVNNEHLGPWLASVSGTTDAGVALTSMRVDGVRASSGAKSLHVTTGMGNPARGTLNQMANMGLIAGNDMYGRAMIYYSNQNGNNVPYSVHSWIFNAQGTSTAAGGGIDLNLGGGGGSSTVDEWQLNYHPPAPTDGGKATEFSVVGSSITAGAWHCIQWQFDGSGTPAADTAKLWVDGKPILNAPDSGVAASLDWKLATPWSSFDVGFNHYQDTNNSVDMSVDDFALDDAVIPCP